MGKRSATCTAEAGGAYVADRCGLPTKLYYPLSAKQGIKSAFVHLRVCALNFIVRCPLGFR